MEYTNHSIGILLGKQTDRYNNNSKSMALYNLNSINTMADGTGNTASKAHKLHLKTLTDMALKEVK